MSHAVSKSGAAESQSHLAEHLRSPLARSMVETLRSPAVLENLRLMLSCARSFTNSRLVAEALDVDPPPGSVDVEFITPSSMGFRMATLAYFNLELVRDLSRSLGNRRIEESVQDKVYRASLLILDAQMDLRRLLHADEDTGVLLGDGEQLRDWRVSEGGITSPDFGPTSPLSSALEVDDEEERASLLPSDATIEVVTRPDDSDHELEYLDIVPPLAPEHDTNMKPQQQNMASEGRAQPKLKEEEEEEEGFPPDPPYDEMGSTPTYRGRSTSYPLSAEPEWPAPKTERSSSSVTRLSTSPANAQRPRRRQPEYDSDDIRGVISVFDEYDANRRDSGLPPSPHYLPSGSHSRRSPSVEDSTSPPSKKTHL